MKNAEIVNLTQVLSFLVEAVSCDDREMKKMVVNFSRLSPCPDLLWTRSELREKKREGREVLESESLLHVLQSAFH